MANKFDQSSEIEYLSSIFLKNASNLEDRKSRLLEAFDELNRLNGKQYYVSLYDLRNYLSYLSREDFDEALNGLRRDWILTASQAEGRHESVPKHILEAGIIEHHGGDSRPPTNLVYVARRQNDDDEDD